MNSGVKKSLVKQREMVAGPTVELYSVHRTQSTFGVGQIEAVDLRGPRRSNLRPANKTKYKSLVAGGRGTVTSAAPLH